MEASDVMAERGIRHLVITEEGRVVGMISVPRSASIFQELGNLVT